MPVPAVGDSLRAAAQQLAAISTSARLDAELLLAQSTQQSRAWLLTWPQIPLSRAQWQQFHSLLERRLTGEPMAYILGKKAFWSMDFKVSPATLIPRPESELCVELALQAIPHDKDARVLDVGTGCGAIILSIKSERPHWHCVGSDCSKAALTIAQQNGLQLADTHKNKDTHPLPVQWVLSDLLADIQGRFDVIVSNPPYIAVGDDKLAPEVAAFEPRCALYADEAGLYYLRRLVVEARGLLRRKAWLIVEHGCDQGVAVKELFEQNGYHTVSQHQDLAGHLRVTMGQLDNG